MKKVLSVFAVMAVVAFSFACKKGGGDSSKYEIKSGSFTYEMKLPGMKPLETTTFFDDYGAKECSETKIEMKVFGQVIKQHTRSIMKDGYSYQLDMVEKKGTKSKINMEELENMQLGFAALAAAMKDKIKIKELGTEEFLGKQCRKIEVTMDEGKSTGTFWLWKNITLKMETSEPATKQKMTFAATKIEELPKVSSELFEIPSDFKITEMKIPDLE